MPTNTRRSRRWKLALDIAVLIAGALVMNSAAIDVARGAGGGTAQHEVIPGAERLTSAERELYRMRMATAATAEEKERVRAEFARRLEAPATRPVGDPARGAEIHRACFGCHGVERYVAPVTHAAAGFVDWVLRASGFSDLPSTPSARFRGRVTSLAQLREGVVRRNDYLNPRMTEQEIEDVVAYLNVTYYRFPQ